MNPTEFNHVERLRAMVLSRFTAAQVPDWLIKHTKLGGRPFSFKNHEYQEVILRDDSQEKVIIKPSQVGLSETSIRTALALANIISPYTIAYTLPTAGFASMFVKTRLDPVIATSPYARDALNTAVDNSEVKMFGESFIHFRGCAAGNAAISIPVDHLMHDEVDFSDQEVLSQYESRITHSEYKRKTKLSTPTLPDFGIDAEFKASRRHFNMVKCNHCNHWFQPDYYKHVRVPGFLGDLREVNKSHLPRIRWQEAALHCPDCGGVPSLQPEFREFVCENPTENHVAAGYQVSPFDAPNIITCASLVKTSTNYKRPQDFVNFGLGLAMEDKDATFTREELEALFVRVEGRAPTFVMGLDLGITSHLMVAAVGEDESMLVVHAEKVPVGALRTRIPELSLQWNVSVIVSDSQPYTETIIAMQANMPNLFGAVYIRSKAVEIYNVKMQEEDEKKGKELVRQVNINRDKAFDAYMGAVRGGMVAFQDTPERQDIVQHHLDMKRGKIFDDSNEIAYTWKKSALGNDHYHHAALYTYIASKLKGTAHVSSISSFAVRTILLPEKVLNPADEFWAKRRGWGSGL
jgi:hypothetical protein